MAADAIFNAADLNADGRIDINEFRNLVGNNVVGGVTSWDSSLGSLGWGAGWGSGWSSDVSLGGAYDASLVGTGLVGSSLVGTGLVGTGLVGTGLVDTSVVGGGIVGGGIVGSGLTGYESVVGSTGLVSDASLYLGGAAVDAASLAASQVHYATDAQGLYQDPNPHIIRRANPSGVQTYTQNVHIRHLQPPPVPPPGPLIIKEVRPPQPPVPPALHLRQVAPPLPKPPPVILREQPPPAPGLIPSQTVIRRLPGIPVPPRSVVVERLPPAPQRPRDVFIERWLPYGPRPARRTLVQRAALPPPYPSPKNVIVQYEQSPARVVRQINRLGVVQANPAAYVQTHGASLLDSASLVSSARSVGVVEDISAAGVGVAGYGLGAYGLGLVNGGVVDSSLALGGVVDSSVALGGVYGYNGLTGLGLAGSLGYGAGWGGSWGTGLVGGITGTSCGTCVDGTDAAFLSADTNLNGTLDRNEFRNLLAASL